MLFIKPNSYYPMRLWPQAASNSFHLDFSFSNYLFYQKLMISWKLLSIISNYLFISIQTMKNVFCLDAQTQAFLWSSSAYSFSRCSLDAVNSLMTLLISSIRSTITLLFSLNIKASFQQFQLFFSANVRLAFISLAAVSTMIFLSISSGEKLFSILLPQRATFNAHALQYLIQGYQATKYPEGEDE